MLKQYSPSSSRSRAEQGMSVVELLVASVMGLLLTGMIVEVALTHRTMYLGDIGRTRINQNIRSGMDIIGSQIREAGERLPSNFPALEVVDGASGAPDEIVLRRNQIDDVLVLCQAIASGSSSTNIFLSRTGTPPPSCTYANQLTAMTVWDAYRTANGGTVQAYLYNQVTKIGEFFPFVAVNNSGSAINVRRSAGSWTNSYNADLATLYILEEWRLRLNNGIIELIVNRDTATPRNVIDGITNFQVQVIMQDGTSRTSFTTTDAWSDVAGIEVTLTGQDSAPGRRVATRSLTARYMPRNILSN